MHEEMTCRSVRSSLWEPEASSREAVANHLNSCRECAAHGADVRSLRSGLRHLPVKHVSPVLNTRLRILASRERARMLARRDFSTWMRQLARGARVRFDNLLKPFAVPAAGGILASFLCFGVIVDTLHVVPDWENDMPVGLFTEVTIAEPSPFTHANGPDVMVQLTVDSKGNVTDYELPQEHHASADEMQEIGNLVLFTSFTPAKRFGQPVSSKRLFLIRHISIKG